MLKKEPIKHSCRITVRYTPAELSQLNKSFRASTCKKISEYIRNSSLHKPVTLTYRNQSADDFLSEMVQLKNELNHIGNNFNQAVHKLHTLDTVPEIKTWLLLNEAGKKLFFQKTEEIKQRLQQIYQQWLQE